MTKDPPRPQGRRHPDRACRATRCPSDGEGAEDAIGVKLSTPRRRCSGLAYSVDYVTEGSQVRREDRNPRWRVLYRQPACSTSIGSTMDLGGRRFHRRVRVRKSLMPRAPAAAARELHGLTAHRRSSALSSTATRGGLLNALRRAPLCSIAIADRFVPMRVALGWARWRIPRLDVPLRFTHRLAGDRHRVGIFTWSACARDNWPFAAGIATGSNRPRESADALHRPRAYRRRVADPAVAGFARRSTRTSWSLARARHSSLVR